MRGHVKRSQAYLQIYTTEYPTLKHYISSGCTRSIDDTKIAVNSIFGLSKEARTRDSFLVRVRVLKTKRNIYNKLLSK